MTTNKLISKSAFIVVVLLIAGVSSANIRTLLWDDPWCSSFSADGTFCLRCSFRCYMDKNGRCQPVSDFCKTWDNCTGKCTSCYPGYPDPVNGVCSSNPTGTPPVVDDHCSQYGYIDAGWKVSNKWFDGCKKVCTKCDCGYYLTCNYTCILLPQNCLAADKYGECTECKDGYHLEKGDCVKDVVENPVQHCIEYGYIDNGKKWQSKWVSGCMKVCKACQCGYYLNCNYTCSMLPDNCKTADMSGECTECVARYHLEDGECVKDDDHCAQYGYVDSNKKWYNSWINGCKKVCKCCDKGYYLNCDYKCIELPEHCEDADVNGKCTDCCDGYHLEGGKCVKDDDHCAEYGYVDASGKLISKWASGCKKVCKCCDKGYFLNSKYQCVKYPAKCEDVDKNGDCKQCCDGYHVEKGVCVVNDANCDTYAWIDCEGNWYSSWALGRSQACKCCDKGYYLNCEGVCVKYPTFCEQVDEKGNCKDCCKGYHVQNGLCVINDKNCDKYAWIDCDNKWYDSWAPGRSQACKCCEQGYYPNIYHICIKYPFKCEQIDKNGDCKQCCDGYHIEKGVCVINDANCETYAWIDCDGNWYSQWALGRSQACKCCEQGYYPNIYHICIKYPFKCQDVDKNGDCKQCCDGYHVEKGVCVVNDANCEKYVWVDCQNNTYSSWALGRSQVCKCCEDGFYLDTNSMCKTLPCHCEKAKPDGTCICCEDGYELCDGKCVQTKGKGKGKK